MKTQTIKTDKEPITGLSFIKTGIKFNIAAVMVFIICVSNQNSWQMSGLLTSAFIGGNIALWSALWGVALTYGSFAGVFFMSKALKKKDFGRPVFYSLICVTVLAILFSWVSTMIAATFILSIA